MDIQSESQDFTIEVDKSMTSEVATTLWANNMDLLAVTTFDNFVQLFRINYKAQKVFQIEEDKTIKGIAFSPNSQFLVYGLSDGSIKLLKTENGEQILSLDGAHTGQLQSLTFVPYCSLDSTSFIPFQNNTLQSKLILHVSPHKNCNRNAIVKINYFTQIGKEFNILLSSDRNKTILLLNGFLPIAQILYSDLAFNSPRTIYSHYDGKIKTILGEEKGTQTQLWLLECEAKVIQEWKEPLIKSSCFLGYILQAFSFVEVAYDAAEVIVRDSLRQYNQKMNLIDDPNIQNISPCEQLFRFLNCGTTSTSIVNFFTKEVYDTKILEKLDQTLNQCFSKLHDLLLESIQNSLERATILLCKLKDLAQGSQGQKLGLNIQLLRKAQKKLIKMYTMGEVLLVESTEAKFDIRNLLVWLNKATIKSAGENEADIENSKSYLNKYTVDFARLHNFLSSQQTFKLQNLLTFFSKTNQTNRIHLQEPDFNIFKAKKNQDKTQEEIQNFNKFAKLLDVEEIITPKIQPMDIEQTYCSFKWQMRELKEQWKTIMRQPVDHISGKLKQGWKKTLMGVMEESQLFNFQVKTILKDNQLIAYFVERLQDRDRLVKYNCDTKTRESLFTTQHHILSIAVSQLILAVLESKFTGKKMVVEVVNEVFDDGQIQIGRKINRGQEELDINCSLRGLNSLVIDKNKLVIFD